MGRKFQLRMIRNFASEKRFNILTLKAVFKFNICCTGMNRLISTQISSSNSNLISYPYILLIEKCTDSKDLKKIHAHAIIQRLTSFTYLTSRLLRFYILHKDLHHAHKLFDQIPSPGLYNWNAIIIAFSNSLKPKIAFRFYTRMKSQRVAPDIHTFPSLIKACDDVSLLSQIHGQVHKYNFDIDVYVTSSLINKYCKLGYIDLASKVFHESPNKNTVCWTSLVSGYSTLGMVDEARVVFDSMAEKNDVSWSAMINGYVQNERYEEALDLFHILRNAGSSKLNISTLVCVLSACGAMGALEEGKWIHCYIDNNELDYGVELGTALVDFYSKCGMIEPSRRVFDKMQKKDVMAWSAMITGLALNGDCLSSIKMYDEMLRSKVKPNAITFIGVLSACKHGGFVDLGRWYFNEMTKKYKISPMIEHYGCMVHLFSLAGRLREAEELIEGMPMKPDAAIWGSVFNGCMIHGYVDLGERIGRKVVELEPKDCGRYVGLANLYAKIGRWEGVSQVRRVMKEKGVRVVPGWSLIEVDGVSRKFFVDDRRQPDVEEIKEMLKLVFLFLDTNLPFHFDEDDLMI